MKDRIRYLIPRKFGATDLKKYQFEQVRRHCKVKYTPRAIMCPQTMEMKVKPGQRRIKITRSKANQISSKTIIMNNHAYKILSFLRERPSTKPNIRTIKRGQPRNFEFNFNFKLYQFCSFIFHSFLLKTSNTSSGDL